MNVWVDGSPEDRISVRDRGLLYGDGLFETMLVRDGRIRLQALHLERLLAGAARLQIRAPASAVIESEWNRAARAMREGVLKCIVTRGAGSRGYRPSGAEVATRVLIADPLPEHVQGVLRPAQLRLCDTRLAGNRALAGLKTLNRLESVLARSEWTDPCIDEGLMLDEAGHVVCGTMTNVFMRFGHSWCTPLLDRCGVAGVMRTWVLRNAAPGTPVIERRVQLDEIALVDEMFLTNAVVGIWPVAGIQMPALRKSLVMSGAAAWQSRLATQ